MTDEEFMKLPEPAPTLQLETATLKDLADLREYFPVGNEHAFIKELPHGE